MAYDADGNFYNPYSPGTYEYEMEEGTRGQEPGTGGVVTTAQTPDILRVQQAAPPRGFNTFNQITGLILSVATMAVPGLGEAIGSAILGGSAATVGSVVGLSAAQVSTAVGSAALSAASTAAQGGSVEDVLKNAASAGFASGINLILGGGVTGAAAGSVAGTAIRGGNADQVLTNAFAAGVGAGVQGVIGPAAGTIARDLIVTGGVSDQTLLNAAAAEINGFNKPGNASAQIVEGQRTATPEEFLTQQILAESEKVGQNLGTGTQVASAGTGTTTDAGGGVSVTPQLTKEQEEQIRTNGVYEDENGDIRNPDGSIVLRFSQTGGTGGAGAGQEKDTSEEARNRQLITVVGLNLEGTDVANTGTPEAKYAGQVGSTSGPQTTLPLDFFTNKVFDSPEQKDNFVLQWINLINSSPESSKPTLNAQLNDIRNASVNPAASSTTTSATSELTGGAAGADTQFENDILNLISGGAESGLGANGGPGAGAGATDPYAAYRVAPDTSGGGGTLPNLGQSMTAMAVPNLGGPPNGRTSTVVGGGGTDNVDPFANYVRPSAPDTSGGGKLPEGWTTPTPMAVPDLGGPPSGGGASTIVGGGGNDEVDPFAGYVRKTLPEYNIILDGVAPTPMKVPDLGGPPTSNVTANVTSDDTYVRPTLPEYNIVLSGVAPTPMAVPILPGPPSANVTANVTSDDTYVRPTLPEYNIVLDGVAPTPMKVPDLGGPPTSNVTANVTSNVVVTGSGSNNIANVAYPTITRVPPPPPPRRQPIITGVSPARLLADALAAYRPAGAIEGEESGKERQNVWNEKSLRLKDALGL
jgi:hypothetical protein